MSKLCLACSESSPLKGKTNKVANWVKKQGRDNALPVDSPDVSSKQFYPESATVRIRMKIAGPSTKSRKILFWAANPKKIDGKILDAPTSYGCYENKGIANVDKKGFVNIKVMAPRPYKESNQIWPPHVHYSYANKTGWSKAIYAIAAYPGHHGKKIGKRYEYEMHCIDHSSDKCSILTPAQVKKNWKKLVVVNALPEPYQIDYKLNEQLRVPYKSPESEIKKAARKIGNKAYVVYCAKPTCIAASKLIGRLIKNGCYNVYYMPGGMKYWK